MVEKTSHVGRFYCSFNLSVHFKGNILEEKGSFNRWNEKKRAKKLTFIINIPIEKVEPHYRHLFLTITHEATLFIVTLVASTFVNIIIYKIYSTILRALLKP